MFKNLIKYTGFILIMVVLPALNYGMDSFTFICTGAVHGEVDPCGWKAKRLGGLARRATIFNQQNFQQSSNTVILDAGDLFIKSPIMEPSYEHKDKLANIFIEAHNRMGYDFLNIGDNDLKLGLDKLKELEKQANFDFISANIISGDTKKTVFKPYKIITLSSIKFGFIGLASKPEGLDNRLEVQNPIVAYQNTRQKIENECDFIIAVIALNATDEHNFISGDIQTDLIISANQYRYSKYIQSQQDKLMAYTDHSGKRIVKITGNVKDKQKGFGNNSEIEYRYAMNRKRMQRYEKMAGDQSIREYFEKQPRVIKMIDRLKKQQEEYEEALKTITNPLSLELIEVELHTDRDDYIRRLIEKFTRQYKKI